MVIVCTLDNFVRTAAPHIVGWGTVHMLPTPVHPAPILSQAAATTALQNFLGLVAPGEDICFSAHGNGAESGGDGGPTDPWGWNAAAIAAMLNTLAANGWHGRVLFHVCCESVANFSAGVAVALGTLNRHGVSCYGYNRSVGSKEGVPSQGSLDKNVSLQVSIS